MAASNTFRSSRKHGLSQQLRKPMAQDGSSRLTVASRRRSQPHDDELDGRVARRHAASRAGRGSRRPAAAAAAAAAPDDAAAAAAAGPAAPAGCARGAGRGGRREGGRGGGAHGEGQPASAVLRRALLARAAARIGRDPRGGVRVHVLSIGTDHGTGCCFSRGSSGSTHSV